MIKRNKYLMTLVLILLPIIYFVQIGGKPNERACIGNEKLPYMDSSLSPDKRVEDLLSRMTIEERIGQMTQISKGALRPGDVSEYFIQRAIGHIDVEFSGFDL